MPDEKAEARDREGVPAAEAHAAAAESSTAAAGRGRNPQGTGEKLQRGPLDDFKASVVSNVIEVRTWEECRARIEGIRHANEPQASKLLFRGMSDSTWQLSTTLERHSGEPNIDFKDYYRVVLRIRSEIETESGLRWDAPSFEEISSWAETYDFPHHYEVKAYEYLAHLRHNGFPSPLLDWSWSPYVAAYFAFSDGTKQCRRGNIRLHGESETTQR